MAFAVVAIVTFVAASSIAYPAIVAQPEVQNKQIIAKAMGWAFQRVDSETIEQNNVTLKLVLEIGERRGPVAFIVNASGSVDIDGTVYTIQSGKGLIGTMGHVALVHCEGVDDGGNKIVLGIGSTYFWWGGHLYAFRAKAFLRTAESPMLLLVRGLAKVQ